MGRALLAAGLMVLVLAGGAARAGEAAAPSFTRLDGSRIALADVDRTVEGLMASADVTGLALVLIDGGRIVHSRGYGFRDVERRLPVTERTVFGAASLTKVNFAYLAMQLVDDGVLDLDRPVEAYLPRPLPSYPDWADLADDPRHRRITPRMLLSHTAGFANFRRFNADRKLRLFFEPGSRYAYSGEGLQLLQFVIETVTQQSLDGLMRTRVFEPLGMSRTRMVSDPRFADDLANGYDEWGRSYGPQNRETADAAGSMQTTVRDYANFLLAVMNGTGLSPRSREEWRSPQIRIVSRRQFPTLSTDETDANDAIRLSYGLGWGLYWTPHGKAIFKEGNDNGFRHYSVAFEDSGRALVVMTNSANGEGIYRDLLETVLGNRFTPIEWEGFTPWNALPPRGPPRERR